MKDDVIRIRAVQLTAARRSSHMAEPDEVDAAARRYLADQIRLREEQRTAILIWGADASPPGGPFPDAFTNKPVRPATTADTGNANRHRRRRMAAKARH